MEPAGPKMGLAASGSETGHQTWCGETPPQTGYPETGYQTWCGETPPQTGYPETGYQTWCGETPPQTGYPETGYQTRGRETRAQVRWYTFIDEAGFYELIFDSKLKAAKKFRDWVFTKALPSLRKYDQYKLFDSKYL